MLIRTFVVEKSLSQNDAVMVSTKGLQNPRPTNHKTRAKSNTSMGLVCGRAATGGHVQKNCYVPMLKAALSQEFWFPVGRLRD
jgi:hypothetical protein